jgi:predicted TIM-barrel fold metal-dependent hydrolase
VIVDTHVHVVAEDRERYPLRPTGISLDWFRDAPVTVEDLLERMAAAGVDRAVLVQPMSAYGFDNRYVIDSARTHSDRLTSVVIVDTTDDPARRLRAMASDGVTGVRLFAIGNPTLARLDHSEALGVWEVATELDLPVVVTILSHKLHELRVMLERFPATTVALDHCGFPDVSGGPPYAEAAALFGLATLPNVNLKVSCHLLEQAEATGDPRDLVDQLAATFGADRLLWGSDYPQTHDRPYAALAALGRTACSRLSPADQRRFLGDNALRLWPELGGDE